MLVLPRRLGEPETEVQGWWKGPLEVAWAIPSTTDGPPQSIIDDIRTFWKPYVPLVCTRVFEGPDNRKQEFVYHVIGMWTVSPFEHFPDFGRIVKVERPSGFPFHGGVIYEQHTISADWPQPSWQFGRLTPAVPVAYPDQSLPPGIMACERVTRPPVNMQWDLTREWIRKSIYFWREVAGTVDQKFTEIQNQRKEAEQKASDKIDDDADYKMQQYRNVFKSAVAEGRLLPLPRVYEPKQYAFQPSSRFLEKN